jgi:hypothetical protein
VFVPEYIDSKLKINPKGPKPDEWRMNWDAKFLLHLKHCALVGLKVHDYGQE